MGQIRTGQIMRSQERSDEKVKEPKYFRSVEVRTGQEVENKPGKEG